MMYDALDFFMLCLLEELGFISVAKCLMNVEKSKCAQDDVYDVEEIETILCYVSLFGWSITSVFSCMLPVHDYFCVIIP